MIHASDVFLGDENILSKALQFALRVQSCKSVDFICEQANNYHLNIQFFEEDLTDLIKTENFALIFEISHSLVAQPVILKITNNDQNEIVKE